MLHPLTEWSLQGALVFAAPDEVVCRGCGDAWWEQLLSFGSLLLAATALAVSLAALQQSKEMLGHSKDMRDDSAEMLALARSEREEQRAAAARQPNVVIEIYWRSSKSKFRVLADGEKAPEDEIVIRATNRGEAVATGATINIFIPARFGKPGAAEVTSSDTVLSPAPEPDGQFVFSDTKVEPSVYFSATGLTYGIDVRHVERIRLALRETPDEIPVAVWVGDITGRGWNERTVLRTITDSDV